METAMIDYDVFVENTTRVKLIEGFTPRQRAEFERGISIEDYAHAKKHKYFFKKTLAL